MIYLKVFPKHTSYESELNVGGEDFEIPNVSYCDDADDIHYNPYNTVEFYVGEITEPQTVKIYTDTNNFDEVIVSEGNKWYSYLLPKDKGLCKIESGLYDGDSEEWSNGIVKKVVVKANINYNYDGNNDRYNGIVPWEITEASFKGSNTSKVTDMSSMFNGCSGLTSLDVSNFDTSNVTSMSSMFSSCSGLASLDLSNFNTSNVTNMHHMFSSCPGLTSLDLSKFDTSKVTYMHNMFYGCSRLTSLDLSGWDTSNVTDMSDMFDGCTSLNTIRMKGCNQTTIQNITNVKPSGATIVTE